MTGALEFYDLNCVIGPPKKPTAITPYRVDQLTEDMERFGIVGALVSHHDAIERGVHEGNAKLLTAIAGDDRFAPAFVAPMHTAIDYPDADSMVDRMLADGAPYHGSVCEPWALGPLWPALERRRVPVLLDRSALGVYPDQPSLGFTAVNIHQICRMFPELPVVLLRINFSALRVVIPLMKECPNLHVELSFFTAHRGVEVLDEHVGHERLLFGSGWPWASAGPGVAVIRYSGLDVGKQREMAAGNARRLLSGVRS
jgi:predicted TIM-barrel fold metal-dependent hydrolase